MDQSHEEQRGSSPGLRIIRRSLVLGAVGIAPLLLYAIFGPRNGNPIGLGLLAVTAVPLSLCGVFIGAVRLVVDRFARDRD